MVFSLSLFIVSAPLGVLHLYSCLTPRSVSCIPAILRSITYTVKTCRFDCSVGWGVSFGRLSRTGYIPVPDVAGPLYAEKLSFVVGPPYTEASLDELNMVKVS